MFEKSALDGLGRLSGLGGGVVVKLVRRADGLHIAGKGGLGTGCTAHVGGDDDGSAAFLALAGAQAEVDVRHNDIAAGTVHDLVAQHKILKIIAHAAVAVDGKGALCAGLSVTLPVRMYWASSVVAFREPECSFTWSAQTIHWLSLVWVLSIWNASTKSFAVSMPVYDALGVMPDLVMASDTVISKLLSFWHVVGQAHLQLHLTAARAVCDDVAAVRHGNAGRGLAPAAGREVGKVVPGVLLHDPLGELLEKPLFWMLTASTSLYPGG